MTIPRRQLWRIALVLAGVAMAVGGSQHPDSDAEDSLRDELAMMTASDTWVLSHTLLAIGSALLAVGLWGAYRNRSWPDSTRRALRVGAMAMSLYGTHEGLGRRAYCDTLGALTRRFSVGCDRLVYEQPSDSSPSPLPMDGAATLTA